jgi:hypothetical protein
LEVAERGLQQAIDWPGIDVDDRRSVKFRKV